METIKRSELVELSIPANATGRINFQTIPQLRNQPDQIIVIKGIEIFLDTTYGNSQTNNAVVGMPAAELPKCVLVLYVNGEESIKMIPLAKLINVNDQTNPYRPFPVEFDSLTNVDFDKSYVQFNAAAQATAYVIPFAINYIRLVKNSQSVAANSSSPSGAWTQG